MKSEYTPVQGTRKKVQKATCLDTRVVDLAMLKYVDFESWIPDTMVEILKAGGR